MSNITPEWSLHNTLLAPECLWLGEAQKAIAVQESRGVPSALYASRVARQNSAMPSVDERFRVVFVCSGNICRSPMAEVVFRRLAQDDGLGSLIVSTSASTGDWHVGEEADVRTVDALARRGYDGSAHRAKQFQSASFASNDLVVALDRSHERILRHWAPQPTDMDKIALLLSFDPHAHGNLDVPDPYYGGPDMFDDALAMIESACRALFEQLAPAFRALRSANP